MIQKLFCLLLLSLSILHPATAVTVEDLYTVEVPVADQTTSLRLEAFTEAFKQVVVKVSGSDDALRSPAFARPIERSARYVKQFSYTTREAQSAQELDANLLYLKMDFDKQSIESLLRDNNFAIWGRERPGSLMVISYDVNETIKLVSDDGTPELVKLLDAASNRQGLPMLFPLMDLEDISLVRVGDVVSRHFDKIEIMARRYSPDALVVGQIVGRTDTGWFGDWEARFDDQIFRWQYRDSSEEAIVNQLVKHLARILALEFALENHQTSDQDLLMSVSSMSGISQVIAVQQYLLSLNVVESVRVGNIQQAMVTFRIKLRNDVEDFQRLIEFGDVLEQQELPQLNAQDETAVTLNYVYTHRGANN